MPTPQGPETDSPETGGPETEIGRPQCPEATHESAEKLLSILAKPGIGQCSGWVGFRNETAGLGQGSANA